MRYFQKLLVGICGRLLTRSASSLKRNLFGLMGLFASTFSVIAADIYVVPEYRTGTSENHYNEDPNFANWVGFDVAYTDGEPPFEGMGYNQVNHPYRGGNTEARIGQYGASNAIITSNLGIYSWTSDATAFYVYDNPTYSPGSILFQTKTYAGSQLPYPDLDSIELYYRSSSEEEEWLLATLELANYATGSDSLSNTYLAWEWDTSSLSIYDYYINFGYELSHSSLSGAQLDTNETYEPSLEGFGVTIRTNIFYGVEFGLVEKSPDKMVYEPGESVTVTVTTNTGYIFAKWQGEFGESYNPSITFTLDRDVELDLIIAPRTYYNWRSIAFSGAHGGMNMTNVWPMDVDYDEDGRVNLLEYALGGNPELVDLETANCVIENVEVGGVVYPSAVYTRQLDPEDVDYVLEVSNDLVNWKDDSDPEGPFFDTPELIEVIDSGAARMRSRLLEPVSTSGPVFVRMSVIYD